MQGDSEEFRGVVLTEVRMDMLACAILLSGVGEMVALLDVSSGAFLSG
jgi:hypothetical protein